MGKVSGENGSTDEKRKANISNRHMGQLYAHSFLQAVLIITEEKKRFLWKMRKKNPN